MMAKAIPCPIYNESLYATLYERVAADLRHCYHDSGLGFSAIYRPLLC